MSTLPRMATVRTRQLTHSRQNSSCLVIQECLPQQTSSVGVSIGRQLPHTHTKESLGYMADFVLGLHLPTATNWSPVQHLHGHTESLCTSSLLGHHSSHSHKPALEFVYTSSNLQFQYHFFLPLLQKTVQLVMVAVAVDEKSCFYMVASQSHTCTYKQYTVSWQFCKEALWQVFIQAQPVCKTTEYKTCTAL